MSKFSIKVIINLLLLTFLLCIKSKFVVSLNDQTENDLDIKNNLLEETVTYHMNNYYEEQSPCNITDSPFTDCVSLNPKLISRRNNREIRYHSSLLYLANYIKIGDSSIEKVILKKPVKFHSFKFKRYPDEDGLDHELDDESYMDESIDNTESEIMKYLYEEVKYTFMPRLIDHNWNNMGWIVMSYFDGISLQEFYQGIYKDIDDIKIQNNHKFQDRMILKKGIIYKELQDKLNDSNQKENINKNSEKYGKLDNDKNDTWFLNLLLLQYNAISHVFIDLLKKGIIHCNPSPSSIMIRKGTLGINPNDIILVDYSQSVKWNIETSQIFFSDIKQSCIPDLRPILAFLLADFEVYIPLSSIDTTFFGKLSLAPINILSTIEDSTYSGQCIDYNNLLRDYYNTNFHCKDLLLDYYSDQFNYIDCNTQLPFHSTLPYNFRIFHFCQKTCGICNKECESLVSIMNTEVYEDSLNNYNQILKESLVERLFRACKPNLELLSHDKLSNHWINQKWTEEVDNKDKNTIKDTEHSFLGCKLCIKHQHILQNILLQYELPQVLLYPNIDLFIGNINTLINGHLNIQNSFKNYLISLNNKTFKQLLSNDLPIINNNLKGNLINRWKDLSTRNTLMSILFLGKECIDFIKFDIFHNNYENNNVLNFKKLTLKNEFSNITTGLLYYKIVKDEFMLVNINIIRQSFVRYTIKGFDSKYKRRILQMLKIYSLKLLPNSLRVFPTFETSFKENLLHST